MGKHKRRRSTSPKDRRSSSCHKRSRRDNPSHRSEPSRHEDRSRRDDHQYHSRQRSRSSIRNSDVEHLLARIKSLETKINRDERKNQSSVSRREPEKKSSFVETVSQDTSSRLSERESSPDSNLEGSGAAFEQDSSEEEVVDTIDLTTLNDPDIELVSAGKTESGKTAAVVSSNQPEANLDDFLGEIPCVVPKYGIDISEQISLRWNPILQSGVKPEDRTGLMKKFLVPNNLRSADAPILNPEMESVILADGKKKDDFIISFQKQLAAGISGVGSGISKLLEINSNKEEIKSVCQTLHDSGRLLCDLQYRLSLKRRNQITPCLSQGLRKLADSSQCGNLLFGEDLTERVRSLKEVEKLSSQLKPKSVRTTELRAAKPSSKLKRTAESSASKGQNSLNWRGPPRHSYRPSLSGKGAYRKRK